MEGILHLAVVEGKSFAPRDKTGFSDPYCVIVVNGSKHDSPTKVVMQTNNPKFEETFRIKIVNSHEVKYEKRGEIVVEVWDWDRLAYDDFIGRAIIPMTQVSETVKESWYPLQTKPHFHDPVTGEILLKHRIEWKALPVQNLSSINRVQQKVGAKLSQLSRVGADILGKRVDNIVSWSSRSRQIWSHLNHLKPPKFAFCAEVANKYKGTTSFDKEELELLFYAFRSFCYPDEQINRQKFCKVFPALEGNDVIYALFGAFNLDPQDVVSRFYEQFGTVGRARFIILTKAIIKLLNAPFSDDELSSLVKQIFGEQETVSMSKFMVHLHTIDTTIKPSSDKIIKLGSSLDGAEEVSFGVGNCFGLFHYLYTTTIGLIEQMVGHGKVNGAHVKPEKEGFLLKKSGSSWAKYWFVLRDGFLYYYRDPADEFPARVVFLEVDSNVDNAPDFELIEDTQSDGRARSNSRARQRASTSINPSPSTTFSSYSSSLTPSPSSNLTTMPIFLTPSPSTSVPSRSSSSTNPLSVSTSSSMDDLVLAFQSIVPPEESMNSQDIAMHAEGTAHINAANTATHTNAAKTAASLATPNPATACAAARNASVECAATVAAAMQAASALMSASAAAEVAAASGNTADALSAAQIASSIASAYASAAQAAAAAAASAAMAWGAARGAEMAISAIPPPPPLPSKPLVTSPLKTRRFVALKKDPVVLKPSPSQTLSDPPPSSPSTSIPPLTATSSSVNTSVSSTPPKVPLISPRASTSSPAPSVSSKVPSISPRASNTTPAPPTPSPTPSTTSPTPSPPSSTPSSSSLTPLSPPGSIPAPPVTPPPKPRAAVLPLRKSTKAAPKSSLSSKSDPKNQEREKGKPGDKGGDKGGAKGGEKEKEKDKHKKHEHFIATRENTFKIRAGPYTMVLAAKNEKHKDKWMDRVYQHTSADINNVYGSYAPLRPCSGAEYYVDGHDYYRAVEASIKEAREQIFITDWFLSPEVYLNRDTESGAMTSRLDHLLKEKAKSGVKIYIMVWNETKLALNLNSERVKSVLESADRNITVICHPIMMMKWSHHQKTVIIDQDVAFLGGLDLCFGRFDTQAHNLEDSTAKVFPGKDYYNPSRGGDFDGLENPFKDLVSRARVPRMPWHDVSVKVEGYPARDVAKNFIQRWNHHRDQIQMSSRLLTPKSTLWPYRDSKTCQILRSLSEWSGQGCNSTESSIHTAMVNTILEAKHFIYIENQYFISISNSAGGKVRNEIASALVQRIRKAIFEKKIRSLAYPNFRVIVVLPVHPEGTYKDSIAIRYIMKWQYNTICRGGNSILEVLQKEFPEENLNQYISFHALRNYGILEGMVVTEQIYVHTKLMIVDDKRVIVGSANINDRSLVGDRDSEIAVVIDDEDLVSSKMAGRPCKFALNLRLSLWREHLGLGEEEARTIMDPVQPESFDLRWQFTSRNNTSLYTQVFGILEGDTVEKIRDIAHQRKPLATPETVSILNQIKGHLVEYPLNFLKTVLQESFASVDIIVAGDEVFQ